MSALLPRAAAALITAAWVAYVPSGPFVVSLVVVGFGHYALALVYARRRARGIASGGRGRAALAVTSGAAISCFLLDVPLVLPFMVHHAFGDAYTSAEIVDAKRRAWVQGARVAAWIGAYGLLLGWSPSSVLRAVPEGVWLAVLLTGSGAAAMSVWGVRRQLGSRHLLDQLGVDVVTLLVVLVLTSLERTVFFHVVLYHFVAWVFLPAPRLLRAGPGALLRYVVVTMAVTAAAALGVVGPILAGVAHPYFVLPAFTLMSFVHILTSLALSDANPRAVRALTGQPLSGALAPDRGSSSVAR